MCFLHFLTISIAPSKVASPLFCNQRPSVAGLLVTSMAEFASTSNSTKRKSNIYPTQISQLPICQNSLQNSWKSKHCLCHLHFLNLPSQGPSLNSSEIFYIYCLHPHCPMPVFIDDCMLPLGGTVRLPIYSMPSSRQLYFRPCPPHSYPPSTKIIPAMAGSPSNFCWIRPLPGLFKNISLPLVSWFPSGGLSAYWALTLWMESTCQELPAFPVFSGISLKVCSVAYWQPSEQV